MNMDTPEVSTSSTARPQQSALPADQVWPGRRWLDLARYGIPLALLLLFPLVSGTYQLNLLAKFLVYGLLALSLDLLWGYAGVLSFAQAVFFGLGAYALALVLLHWGNLPGATYIGLLLAVGLPALLALVLGYAMFFGRVGGVYFAIVTFAVGAIVQSITIVWIEFTGGLNGLYGYPNPSLGIPGIWEVEISGNLLPYYLIVIVLLLSYIFVWRLVNSPFGQALRAINSNEERVEFLGYNVPGIKLIVFVISCALAGLSGALYVPVGFVTAEIMGLLFSTAVIVWVAVGGRGTLYGAILGALLVNYLQVFMSDVLVFYWLLFIGLFFIVVVIFWPEGIVGLVQSLLGRIRSRIWAER
jgi:urea transport system permease protein